MNRRTSGGTSGFSVTASASARVTAPRRPPQRITTLNRASMRWLSRAKLSSGINPKSVSARADSDATTSTPSRSQSVQVMSSIRRGTSSAARMKISELAQKSSCCQRSRRNCQSAGAIFGWARALSDRPATTVATTPETASWRSPRMNTI